MKFEFIYLRIIDLEKNSNLKRKPLINLREQFIQCKKSTHEIIPKKLLNELASLSYFQYKIEIKSKNQCLVLPLAEEINKVTLIEPKKIKFENENDQDIIMDSALNGSVSSSPLENDYIILKCEIVEKNLVLVPPIRIFVPYTYPDSNPFVDCVQMDDCDDDMLPDYSEKNKI